MTLFMRESFEEVIDDIQPLLVEHWRELALYQEDVPLDADYEFYRRASDAGLLRIYTARNPVARSAQRGLIGYAIFAVRERHAHYAHRWAVNDIIWIDPGHRNLGTGMGLFDLVEDDLCAGGPIVIHVETKVQHPELAFLLQKRGYGLVGPAFSRRFA